ncbi:RNA-binding protein 33-like isoform X2 [Mya arenaria]|uniref:RNA-binding protein 33-like isoform X2 n=1 Tax=Mya arenaria TaxID=6604 RepID=UPI0022E36CF8|nr:RNA-binding protein 33-like isoform X2 [Mya arenaria]
MKYICTVLAVLAVTVNGVSRPPRPPQNLGASPLEGPIVPPSSAPGGSPIPFTVEANIQDVGETPTEALSETPAQPEQTYPPTQPEQTYPPTQQGQTYPPSLPEQTYPPSQPDLTYPPSQPELTYPPSLPELTFPPSLPEQTYPPSQPEQTYPPTLPEQTYPPSQPEQTYPTLKPEQSNPTSKPDRPSFQPETQPGPSQLPSKKRKIGCVPGCGQTEICARLGDSYCQRGHICSVCIRMDSIRFPASALQGMFASQRTQTPPPASTPAPATTKPSEPNIPIIEYAARHRGIVKPEAKSPSARPKMPFVTLYKTGQDPSAMMTGRLFQMLGNENAKNKMKPDTPVSNEVGYSTLEMQQQGQLTEGQKVQHQNEYMQQWEKFQQWLKMQKQTKVQYQTTTVKPTINEIPANPETNYINPTAEMVGIQLGPNEQQDLLLKMQQMPSKNPNDMSATQANNDHEATLQLLQNIALEQNYPLPTEATEPQPSTRYALNEQHLQEFNAMIAQQQQDKTTGNATGQTEPAVDNLNMEQLWSQFNAFMKQKKQTAPAAPVAPVSQPPPDMIMPTNTYIPQPQPPSDPFFGDLFGYNSAPQENSLFSPFSMFDGVGMWGFGLW